MRTVNSEFIHEFSKTFDLLLQRHRDKHYSCRISVLKQFRTLLDKQLFDLSQKELIIKALCERIKDISQLVRKNALGLLSMMILDTKDVLNCSKNEGAGDFSGDQQHSSTIVAVNNMRMLFQDIVIHLQELLNSQEEDRIGALEVILAGNLAEFENYWRLFTFSFNLIW